MIASYRRSAETSLLSGGFGAIPVIATFLQPTV
jgi:hypothetical protein